MKKVLVCLILLALIMGLAACAETSTPETVAETGAAETTSETATEEDTTETRTEDTTTEEEQEPATQEYETETVEAISIYGALHRIVYGDNVVYLFGSLHGGREGWYPLADAVEDAMNRADIFATEIGLVDMDEQVAAINAASLLPDGQTWVDFLPTNAYEHAVAMAAAWDMEYTEINIINPAVIVFMLEMEIALLLADDLELGNTAGDISVDGYVMDRALELGRPIIGLETIEQQAQILYNPPFEVVVERVLNWLPPLEMVEAIENSDEAGLDELADMYEANDYALFAELNAVSLSLESQALSHEPLWVAYMREYVMNWRSTYYAHEIARLLQETQEPTTFFIVVGLSHIIRSMSGAEFTDIVEQLALLGIEAEPMWN